MFAFIIITHYHCHRGPRRRWRRRWKRLRRILRTFLGTLGEIASDLFERAPWLLYVLLTPSWSSSRSQRWHWYNHWARAESETETDRQTDLLEITTRNAAVTLLTFAFNLFISHLLRLVLLLLLLLHVAVFNLRRRGVSICFLSVLAWLCLHLLSINC